MTAPRRRWSFSLRTLFVVVTLAACWLGWQLNWIRDRHAFLEKQGIIKSDGVHVSYFQSDELHGDLLPLARKAPVSLRIFQEPGVALIQIIAPEDVADTWGNYAAKLFPEAGVQVSPQYEVPPATQADRP